MRKKYKSGIKVKVFRSNRQFYAQVIDFESGNILLSSSTLALGLKSSDSASVVLVGEDVAQKILDANLGSVSFDRGKYPYRGKVKIVADAIRSKGVKF